MDSHGLLRVAAAVPALKLADPATNAAKHLDLLRDAQRRGVQLVVFPECSLTGYTCADLFHQQTLVQAAESALAALIESARPLYSGIAIVGLPVAFDGMVFNAAAIIHDGQLCGVVPKSYLPTYREFYDARYFAPARNAKSAIITLAGQAAHFGTDQLFDSGGFVLGVEICEDLWSPLPPSCLQATAGATVLVNLSASNETIGKSAYRRQLVLSQSARCIAGYIYASSGPGESSTDLVFGGYCLIAENGTLLAESRRFARDSQLILADLDLSRLLHDRAVTGSFNDCRPEIKKPFFRSMIDLKPAKPNSDLLRVIDPHPFVPSDPTTLNERCEEIFHIQTSALARRLEAAGTATVSIGVSGGLDSTLALLVLVKTFDALNHPRTQIRGLTMPGFGTTPRTKANAWKLMNLLGVQGEEIDIRSLTFEQLKALHHSPFGIDLRQETVETFAAKLTNLPPERRSDLTFENTQARVRTSLLMNAGFTLGTGDLSELCLGWCTYNADHMSMYNVNVSVPKTLVRFLVKWVAEHEFSGDVRATLLDIVDTVISPELLPSQGGHLQSTEDTIGPYELHDFFIYHFLRWGSPPEKILYLASHAKFEKPYTPDEIRRWLIVFLKRFFANQFKRSALPDGPKVGTVSVSPRGDWRMPSDATAAAWLASLQQ